MRGKGGDPTIPIPSGALGETKDETKGETIDPLGLNPGDVLQVAVFNGPKWNPNDPQKYDQLWNMVDILRNNDSSVGNSSRYEWRDRYGSTIGFPISRSVFLRDYKPVSASLYTLVDVKFFNFNNFLHVYDIEPLDDDQIKFPRTYGNPENAMTLFFTQRGGPKQSITADEIISVNGRQLGDSSTSSGDTKLHDDDFPNVPGGVPGSVPGGVPGSVPGSVPGGVPW